MSLGTSKEFKEGLHIVTVHEKVGDGWTFLKTFSHKTESVADWNAKVFIFEEIFDMRIHTDGYDAVMKAMAENNWYPPSSPQFELDLQH